MKLKRVCDRVQYGVLQHLKGFLKSIIVYFTQQLTRNSYKIDCHDFLNCYTIIYVHVYNWAATCDFQQCGILTSVDPDEPVLPPVKLRNSK